MKNGIVLAAAFVGIFSFAGVQSVKITLDEKASSVLFDKLDVKANTLAAEGGGGTAIKELKAAGLTCVRTTSFDIALSSDVSHTYCTLESH